MPGRQPDRFPLGRDARRGRADPAGDAHPAGHDADLAQPRTGPGYGHGVRYALPLDGRGRVMQQMSPGKSDPAPSRWSYRLQRWMLTPGFRFALRAGIPFALIFGASSAYMADQTRRDGINLAIHALRTSIEERPEFMVQMMAVDGAGVSVSQDIREVVPLDFPIS